MSLKFGKRIESWNKVIHTYPKVFPREMQGPSPAVADLSPTSDRSNSPGMKSTVF